MALELKTKHRIVGLIVILALAVIFIPMFFGHTVTNKDNQESQLSAQVPNPSGKPEIQLTIPKAAPAAASVSNMPQQMPSMAEDLAVKPLGTRATPAEKPVPASTQTKTHKPEKIAAKKHFFALEKPGFLSKTHHAAVVKRAEPAKAWTVQLGSFADKKNALKLIKRLRGKGFAAYINQTKGSHGTITQVFVGPELKRDKAEESVKRLQQLFGLAGVVVKYKI